MADAQVVEMPNLPVVRDDEAFGEFIEEIMDDQSLLRVSDAVAKLCDLPTYELEAPFGVRHVAFEESSSRFGTLMCEGKNPAHVTIVTNEWLPAAVSSLFNQKVGSELTADQVVALTADFANAYAVLIRGYMRLPQKQTLDFSETLDESRWQRLGERRQPVDDNYRAAAQIALTANDIKPIDLFATPPLPNHLVSFGNPISKDQVYDLNNVFKHGEH